MTTAARRGLPLLAAALIAATGCGTDRRPGTAQPTGPAIRAYLRQVEPIRLAVNRLLDRADPILRDARVGRSSPARAGRRMGALERRFAAYAVDIAAIAPAAPALRRLHAVYAHTYILEDAYLSALAAGLTERQLDHLPDTQAAQRAAIIEWRTGLAVLARHAGIALPADLDQAGRGEIAPAPGGS